jgi:hypothetical protein
MMFRSLGEGHLCHGWCAWYFCNSPCNPSGELGMSILTRCGHWRSCCFVTCNPRGEVAGSTCAPPVYFCDCHFLSVTPYGGSWVSMFILRRVLEVEVSQLQNCRHLDLSNVRKV